MTETVRTPGVTTHFVARAVERVGCTEDQAHEIGRGLVWAIQNGRSDLVEFVGRVSRDGRRVFRFRWPGNGRVYYALIDTRRMICVTLLPPGFVMKRERNSLLRLKDIDL